LLSVSMRPQFTMPNCGREPCLLMLAWLHWSTTQLSSRMRSECRMS
jgi:hypothetical protein